VSHDNRRCAVANVSCTVAHQQTPLSVQGNARLKKTTDALQLRLHITLHRSRKLPVLVLMRCDFHDCGQLGLKLVAAASQCNDQ
jgi:hypothetical protein